MNETMKFFDALVKSVMMYGTEIWGWKKRDNWKRWANERGMESGLGKERNELLKKRMWSKVMEHSN